MSSEVISENEIYDIRSAVDSISWSMLDLATDDSQTKLRVDYLNKFLIEGFNWFGTDGLSEYFRNLEIELPKIGILKIPEYHIDFPKEDEIGNPNELLYPSTARIRDLSYTGNIRLKFQITWDPDTGKSNLGSQMINSGDWINMGKLPIMLGSAFDNLTKLKTREELIQKFEHYSDYVGYNISKGHEKFLITQNKLKENHPICTSINISQTESKVICSIRSRSHMWYNIQHRAFIMTSAKNKNKHSDNRIYVNINDNKTVFKNNIYDIKKSGQDKGTLGINIISVFRLAIIMLYRWNPLIEQDAYLFGSLPASEMRPARNPGIRGQSTYSEAARLFTELAYNHAGEKLWPKIYEYINDTINEASLDENDSSDTPRHPETTFWINTAMVSMDMGSGDLNMEISHAQKALIRFSKVFMPHCSSRNQWIEIKELNSFKSQISKELDRFHKSSQLANTLETDINAIKDSLDLLQQYMVLKNNTNDPKFIEIQSKLQERGINEPGPIYKMAYSRYISFRNDIKSKLNVLTHMAIRVLRIELGYDNLDNRNNLAMQYFEHAGLLMISRFTSVFKAMENAWVSGAKNIEKHPTVENIYSLIRSKHDFITKEFKSSFSTGKWNLKNADTERNGVVESLPSDVTIQRISFLRRVVAKVGKHSKNMEALDIKGLQIGAICPSETPEGAQCGSVTNLAMGAFLTNESFDPKTLAYKFNSLRTSRRRSVNPNESDNMEQYTNAKEQNPNLPPFAKISLMKELRNLSLNEKPEISQTRKGLFITPLFMNGKFIGWVNGRKFRRRLITMRREGNIHPHTGIGFKQNFTKIGPVTELNVDTSGGRIVQPLIISENPTKTLDFLRSLVDSDPNISSKTFEDLIEEGIVEFVDSAELEFLDVAPSVDAYLETLRDGIPRRYDHILLNPAFVMGPAANMQPYSNMNPVVRNSYFTNMVKQARVMGDPSIMHRTFTTVSELHSGQKPLVKTKIYDHLIPDEPFGTNIDILITTDTFGEEDGIVIRKGFIERGGLSSTKYRTFTMDVYDKEILEFDPEFVSKMEDDQPGRYGRGVIRPTRKVVREKEVTQEDGSIKTVKYFVDVPVTITRGDILARKTWSAGEEFDILAFDDPVREGTIDRILWNRAEKGRYKLSIVIKLNDTIWRGDKLASRFSQKGIVTKVVDDKDMPFEVETGQIPDLIINPQAFPSRMTLGQLAELTTGNAFVLPDKMKVVGQLYERQKLDFYAPLDRLFLVNKQKWDEFSFDDDFENLFDQTDKDTLLNIIIPSINVYDQQTMDWLKENDLFTSPVWVISISRRENGNNPQYIPIITNMNDDSEIRRQIPEGWEDNILDSMTVDESRPIEIIPDLYFDSEMIDDPNNAYKKIHKNPLRGIRVSKLSENVRTKYLRYNALNPVADQYIVSYMDGFFTRKNITTLLFDFIIPDNMLKLNVIDPNINQVTELVLSSGTKYSDLELEDEVTSIVEKSNGQSELTTLSLIELWNSTYLENEEIPKENVIDLPDNPMKIYLDRKRRIDYLRDATAFKADMNIERAMKELQLMGYDADGRKQYIHPITNKPIEGGIVSGPVYTMALKHKVKDKMQARGKASYNSITRRPAPGRTNIGGIRFGIMDVIAAIKSGATAFIHDRLVDAGGKENAFLCTECEEVCYKNPKTGVIVCPICKTDTQVIKTSLPYVFLHARNALMAAGVRLKLYSKPYDEDL